jgi:hypothetical protein
VCAECYKIKYFFVLNAYNLRETQIGLQEAAYAQDHILDKKTIFTQQMQQQLDKHNDSIKGVLPVQGEDVS